MTIMHIEMNLGDGQFSNDITLAKVEISPDELFSSRTAKTRR